MKKNPADQSSKSTDERLVQSQLNLDLQSVPSSVKSPIVSDERLLKQQRTSSSNTELLTPGTGLSDELRHIHESLSEIRESMLKNEDIKSIVRTLLSEVKGV